jgi:hypothetical protein
MTRNKFALVVVAGIESRLIGTVSIIHVTDSLSILLFSHSIFLLEKDNALK